MWGIHIEIFFCHLGELATFKFPIHRLVLLKHRGKIRMSIHSRALLDFLHNVGHLNLDMTAGFEIDLEKIERQANVLMQIGNGKMKWTSDSLIVDKCTPLFVPGCVLSFSGTATIVFENDLYELASVTFHVKPVQSRF
jgi:hypothetical protein